MTYLLGKVWFVGLLACKVTTRERENELVPYEGEGPFHGDSLPATRPIFHTPYQQRVSNACASLINIFVRTNLQRLQKTTEILHIRDMFSKLS